MGLFDLLHSKKKKENDYNNRWIEEWLKPDDQKEKIFFTMEEVAAMCCIGLTMMRFDRDEADEESDALVKELVRFGIMPNTLEWDMLMKYASRDIKEAFATMENMTFDQRKYAVGFLADMMESDLRVTENELKYLIEIAKSINHKGFDFTEEKLYWETCLPYLVW